LTTNLRLSLTVFKVGFAVESASGFAALGSNAAELPYHGALELLSPLFTLFGILFLWIGRHEWNELHRARVGHANLAFALSIIATGLAAAPIAFLTAEGDPTPPGWLTFEFGISVALVFAITFVTYALVASHLVGPIGKVAIAAGLAWAVLLSAAIGLALAPQLHPIVDTVVVLSPAIDSITRPITLLEALLAFSYLAFFVAFADAHYRVVRGLVTREPDDSPAS
jgi:uncharacterized membrane protein YidH (DUF202 family)